MTTPISGSSQLTSSSLAQEKQLLDLPSDVLATIFKMLNFESLKNSSLSCKGLRLIAYKSILSLNFDKDNKEKEQLLRVSESFTTYFPHLIACFPRLITLSLKNRFLTNEMINSIPSDYLEEIDLSNTNISDEGLTLIVNHCKKLKKIDLNSSSKISGMGIQKVVTMCQDLENLNLRATDATQAFSTSINCKKLKTLDLRKCKGIDDEAISQIVLSCPNLLSLTLSETDVTDTSLALIGENCKNLQSLSYENCPKITNRVNANTHRVQPCRLHQF